jgi:hypothetical protein
MQARISFDHHSNGALRSATIMEPVITSAEQCANMIATLACLVSWFGEDTAKGGRKTTERITSTSVLASLPLALPAPKRGPYKKRAKPTEEQTEVPNGTVKRLEIITKGIKETSMPNGDKRYFYLMYVPSKARDGNTAITYKLGPNGKPKYDFYLSPERAKGSKQLTLWCNKEGIPNNISKVTEIRT